MKTSIFVSAEHIQAIGYVGNSVKQFVSFPLPEGTMYNGTITDHAFLTECLAAMKRENPDLFSGGVSLAADGSSILSRRLAAPKLSNKQYLQLVRDDLADSIENPDDLVCGYRKLDFTENAILACGIGKMQVDSYLATFREAGIKLDSIHVGAEIILSYVKAMPEMRASTVVINIIDGLTMLSMLFENGNNVFMTRTRLYGEEKEQLFQNIIENLNGLIVFTRSQSLNEITGSYYLGISESDVRLLEAFHINTDIKLGALSILEGNENIPSDAHFSCLNMLYGSSCIDLVAARRELDVYIKSRRPKKRWIPAVAAYILILAASTAFLWMRLNNVNENIADISSYLMSPAILHKQEELEALIRESATYGEVARQADEKAAWENGLPKATSHMLDFIVFQHGVDVAVTSFDFDESTGSVRVSARCSGANVSADYVDTLCNEGIARSVNYQGYGSNANGEFTFTVDIILMSSADD